MTHMTSVASASQRIRIDSARLAARLAVSKQTLWRWYSNGNLPRPHYLGGKRLWWLDEIENWETKHSTYKPQLSPRCTVTQEGQP